MNLGTFEVSARQYAMEPSRNSEFQFKHQQPLFHRFPNYPPLYYPPRGSPSIESLISPKQAHLRGKLGRVV